MALGDDGGHGFHVRADNRRVSLVFAVAILKPSSPTGTFLYSPVF